MRTWRLACLVLALVQPIAAEPKRLNPSETDVVGRVIKKHAKAFRVCFSRELVRDPSVRGGKVVLAVGLDKAGGVTSARVASTTLRHANIEACLVRAMKLLKFPSEAPRTFNFPFIFTAAG